MKELAELCGMEMVLPMNTGQEVFDTAVKVARRWAYWVREPRIPEGKAEIIIFNDNFHGRSVAATSASTTAEYRDGFGPFLPGFVHVPYGDIDALDWSINSCTAMDTRDAYVWGERAGKFSRASPPWVCVLRAELIRR